MNRILLIDDDQELTKLLTEYLSSAGFQVDAVHTGEDGLRATEVALCAYESAKRREPVACPGVLDGG